ncbi:ECF transporter S component [Dermabacter sp. HSID17554]|uniref:ECF transporter S component n=1 Tax=Dermabacter sp. HSID17554 TaxID=2419511 RepID=UPI000F86C28D|nr:ECF transporter S component [Dermabacter sp. HSID17554]RUP86026.1 ABC transporter permease [Dermabacter sp. HSID17554]
MTNAHAPRPGFSDRIKYRTIDLVVIVMVGVAFGVAFAGYAQLYNLTAPLTSVFPPLEGLLTGFWCLPALVAMLIVRRPGAAFGAEIIAACLEALLGSHFGVGAVISGLLQGAGFEIAFALSGWASTSAAVVIGGSLLSTFFEWLYEIVAYFPSWSATYKAMLLVFFWISALTLLAALGRAIVAALAKAGALNQFSVSRDFTVSAAPRGSSRIDA